MSVLNMRGNMRLRAGRGSGGSGCVAVGLPTGVGMPVPALPQGSTSATVQPHLGKV